MSACAQVRDRLLTPDAEVLSHLESCEACARFAEGDALVFPEALPEPPRFDPQRLGVATAMTGQRRRAWARRTRPLVAAAAVAAVLTATVFVFGPPDLPRLRPGEVLVSASGPREVLLPGDARLVLEAGRAALDRPQPREDRVRLDAGALSLQVPKLAAGRVLSVQTRDALIRVRGTRFRVVVEAASTHVSVSEGIVEVIPMGLGRASWRLGRGEELSVPSLDAYRQGLRTQAVEALGRVLPMRARESLEAWLATEPTGEPGAEALALLAFVHRGAGETSTALALYRRALDQLPGGATPTWAQDACAERALLIGTAEAWRECLTRFPDGVHAGLARSKSR